MKLHTHKTLAAGSPGVYCQRALNLPDQDEVDGFSDEWEGVNCTECIKQGQNNRLYLAQNDVLFEVLGAMKNWPAMHSAHEGYGVLCEEFAELEDHVFLNQKKRNITAMRKEAIQVAAMAMRFVVDVCNEEVGRR